MTLAEKINEDIKAAMFAKDAQQAADQALLASFNVLIVAARSSASANSAGTDDVGK